MAEIGCRDGERQDRASSRNVLLGLDGVVFGVLLPHSGQVDALFTFGVLVWYVEPPF